MENNPKIPYQEEQSSDHSLGLSLMGYHPLDAQGGNSNPNSKWAPPLLLGASSGFSDFESDQENLPTTLQFHKVRKGEMPEKIAQLYGVTVEALRQANPGKWHQWTENVGGFNANENIIIPGQGTQVQSKKRNVVKPAPKIENSGSGSSSQSKNSAKEPATKPSSKGYWVVPPVLGKEHFITQVPPKFVNHDQVLSKEKLFRYALAKYGPGGAQDIRIDSKVRVDWKMLPYQKRLEKVYWMGCYNACTAMLENVGASPDLAAGLSTITEDLKAKTIKSNGNLMEGSSIIRKNLTSVKPIIIGVHKSFSGYNSDATDHYVVGVGIWKEGNKIGIAYFDPGVQTELGWNVSKNLIWIDIGKEYAIDEGNYSGEEYVLSWVRDNK